MRETNTSLLKSGQLNRIRL